MLEEIGLKYKVTKINIYKDEQFKPEFRKLSPFSKIPVIVDHDNNKEAIFESGAILIYLAEKTNKFYDKKERLKINQWLMIQMAIVGPFIGQHHHFHHFNPGKSKYAEDRFFENSIRVYKVLDKILEKNNFLASNDYSIADIATFPWIARHEWHDIGLKNYKNLARWYVEISKRPAVKKGFDCLNTGEKIPVV